MNKYTLFHGDAIEQLRLMADNSVDSVVTDPPYELGFMGKHWDSTGIANSVEMWKEAYRVLKPGGHLLSFGGSRTYHRMASAVEDAGFEIRDQIMWVYGSGFPKSMDVSKAFDKSLGETRECTCEGVVQGGGLGEDWDTGSSTTRPRYDKPVSDLAQKWNGWGTALKPAHEPIVVARKPLIGTVVQNVLEHGTGAINIGACRVGTEPVPSNKIEQWSGFGELKQPAYTQTMNEGRWPANLIHDGSDEVLAAFPEAKGQQGDLNETGRERPSSGRFGDMAPPIAHKARIEPSKSAARFFYCAKANKKDRGETNNHPTVKPTELMQYLCRLVTPLNGIVLDPFAGSGSTGKAALMEGFSFIGIEENADYIRIAEARLSAVNTADSSCLFSRHSASN